MKIEKVAISSLKPYKNNAKLHPKEQIEQIKKSIQDFGMNDPIAIWGKENIVVEGHGRLEALKELGYEEVEVIRLDHLTDEERKAYTLIHNKTTMNSGFDLEILNNELLEINDIDMKFYDFDIDLGIEEKDAEEDNFNIDEVLEKETKTKKGQIYQLGNHRLMCGDSTNEEDVSKLMNGEYADLLYTDPPYNVNVSNSQGMKIENDNMSSQAFKEFLQNAFQCASNNLKAGGAFYIWHADSESVNFRESAEEIRCGDNGIFKGVPLTKEEIKLSNIARDIYEKWNSDGKYILDKNKLIICQSNAKNEDLRKIYKKAIINPLGEWTGGIDVDSGATNRKLGSDMAQSVTGGGLHGKDLSKADVSVNIYAFLKAQRTGKVVKLNCAIGDNTIDGKPYKVIVEMARKYINAVGGFEKFAEWGLF